MAPEERTEVDEQMSDNGVSVARPQVAVVMGSRSDFPTVKPADDLLRELGIPHVVRIVSAHRTPDRMRDFAQSAREQGLKVIIAAAGGAAHLPGMIAAWTTLPVLGVPVRSSTLSGVDSLLSIVQMPAGVPVGTLSIGEAGARNAALLAASILSLNDPVLAARLQQFRDSQADAALAQPLDSPDWQP